MNKGAKNAKKEQPCDHKCSLCKAKVKDVAHVSSVCPFFKKCIYLTMRHDSRKNAL